jgi:hypothetical protein
MCEEASGWMPDIEDIRRKISPRTKGIVVINPNNPTGALYSDGLLQSIVNLAREYGLVIFADEVYDKVLYDGVKHTPIASLSTDTDFQFLVKKLPFLRVPCRMDGGIRRQEASQGLHRRLEHVVEHALVCECARAMGDSNCTGRSPKHQ